MQAVQRKNAGFYAPPDRRTVRGPKNFSKIFEKPLAFFQQSSKLSPVANIVHEIRTRHYMLCFSTFGRVRGNSGSGTAEMRLGLPKLTLLDYPGKVACTVFTPGCNLRCPFCHNASLVFSCAGEIDEETIFSFLKKRTGVLDGMCVTGGEPLLQKDIADFLSKVKALGYLVKLDTNGTFPDRLQPLLEEKLVDYVAMDIKASPDNYDNATGVVTDLEKVRRSVELLKESGVPHEFRTTTVKGIHTAQDFETIAQWLAGEEQFFIQQYKVADDMIGDAFESFSKEELEAFAAIVAKTVKTVAVRGV